MYARACVRVCVCVCVCYILIHAIKLLKFLGALKRYLKYAK